MRDSTTDSGGLMENSGGLSEELSEGLRGTHGELRELRGLIPLILENSGIGTQEAPPLGFVFLLNSGNSNVHL